MYVRAGHSYRAGAFNLQLITLFNSINRANKFAWYRCFGSVCPVIPVYIRSFDSVHRNSNIEVETFCRWWLSDPSISSTFSRKRFYAMWWLCESGEGSIYIYWYIVENRLSIGVSVWPPQPAHPVPNGSMKERASRSRCDPTSIGHYYDYFISLVARYHCILPWTIYLFQFFFFI